MAKDDGKPKCRTCGAVVAPGGGQEVSRWLESKTRHFASNPKAAARAAELRRKNESRGK